ncbi:hypothetical protein AB0K43_01720 [Kitasatospora sp. NPDC049258]|uniref:hypothetical protein n=1 Tax=Kitasatospora sp. NPDC049258 TaxID=3155394 RepID=UPI003443D0BF
MKKALFLVPLLVLTAACGSTTTTATGSKSPGAAEPTTTSPPIERQQRTLACGTTIAPPLMESVDGDPVRFTLTSAAVRESGVAVSYRITATAPETMLSLPIGEVPPTALVLKDGRIVATETPGKPSVEPAPALGFPVGKQPYEKDLTVDRACEGTTFKDVLAHPDRYRAVVVMSVQNAGMPKDAKNPLVQASRALQPGTAG